MRTSRTAILSCAALFGIGTLIGQASPAFAETPAHQGGGMVLTTPTTKPDPHPGPVVHGDIVLPQDDPDPQPPIDPDLPIANPQGHGDPDPCPPIQCDLQLPDGGEDPEPDPCDPAGVCDEIAQPDPGCNVTHGCDDPDDEPDCEGPSCDRPDDGSTDGTTDGEQGTDGSTDGRGRLPHTGGDVLTLAGAGIGLTGIGAALKRLGRRDA